MSAVVTMIAGLGNPDSKYERTLHNAGFWFVDALVRKFGGEFRYEKKFDSEICKTELFGDEVWLVKPQSFMNLSGGPIRGMLDYYRLKAGPFKSAAEAKAMCRKLKRRRQFCEPTVME